MAKQTINYSLNVNSNDIISSYHHWSQNDSNLYHQPTEEIQADKRQISKNNCLIFLATPLIILITQIKRTAELSNVAKLKAQIIDEIKIFEKKLMQAEYPLRTVMAARYCMCTALDEAVLNMSWGTQSIWVQQSLLSLFHKETWGGERFYIILETMAKEPKKNLDFLEYGYLLLSLGFEGKFFGKQMAVREEIRNRIFYRIRNYRAKPDGRLANSRQDNKTESMQRFKKNSVKWIIAVTFTFIFTIYFYYNFQVHRAFASIRSNLNTIATISPINAFSEVIQRPLIERGIS